VSLLEDRGYVVAGSAVKVYQMLAKHYSAGKLPESKVSMFYKINMGTFGQTQTQALACSLLGNILNELSNTQRARGPRFTRMKYILARGLNPDNTNECEELKELQSPPSGDPSRGEESKAKVGPRLERLHEVYAELAREQALTNVHICLIEQMLAGRGRNLTAGED